jgi:hypothetical protein
MDKAGLRRALTACFDSLSRAVDAWHHELPQAVPLPDEDPLARLQTKLLDLHLANFTLWHLEDEARSDAHGPAHVARCKRAIDAENQRRNDCIEQLDAHLNSLITPLLPTDAPRRYNTETMGAALDRLSILQLKIYHMDAETRRKGAGREHVQRCVLRLERLRAQDDDLRQGILELFDDYCAGRKRPNVYRQFKMYNDPETNPALYATRTASDPAASGTGTEDAT